MIFPTKVQKAVGDSIRKLKWVHSVRPGVRSFSFRLKRNPEAENIVTVMRDADNGSFVITVAVRGSEQALLKDEVHSVRIPYESVMKVNKAALPGYLAACLIEFTNIYGDGVCTACTYIMLAAIQRSEMKSRKSGLLME